jgi:hypothetical protein
VEYPEKQLFSQFLKIFYRNLGLNRGRSHLPPAEQKIWPKKPKEQLATIRDYDAPVAANGYSHKRSLN